MGPGEGVVLRHDMAGGKGASNRQFPCFLSTIEGPGRMGPVLAGFLALNRAGARAGSGQGPGGASAVPGGAVRGRGGARSVPGRCRSRDRRGRAEPGGAGRGRCGVR